MDIRGHLYHQLREGERGREGEREGEREGGGEGSREGEERIMGCEDRKRNQGWYLHVVAEAVMPVTCQSTTLYDYSNQNTTVKSLHVHVCTQYRYDITTNNGLLTHIYSRFTRSCAYLHMEKHGKANRKKPRNLTSTNHIYGKTWRSKWNQG